MSTPALARPGKRALSRLRELRRRAAAWRRRLRQTTAVALIAAGMAVGADSASAQMGQAAMAPSGGVVNRAVQGFRTLNQNGPGILYYGVNAADRGLGYQGSYMTLGGYIPGFEDDLGGLWAADVRSHLSVNGGFFSNVGAVRKQFIGGSLLGVGVYWDYDGDLNQYADVVIPGTDYLFAGGQVYNQVGISGEWLTDFGNIRSNGYIPVGTTAEYVGPFVGNSVLCVNGVNAALAGTDLEVGAYIPGLTDWAGMISVGGYAYGNSRYDFADGQDVVPWFGGVYTRLDMTFIENWDFSLQYNNDSYFDSTGFARLTYRMGGSRRRNVPDQMEQPMMRNEHIVRAHQAPEVAINPFNGTPWRVIHVDNTATAPGTGTAESPFTTLGAASTVAVNPYDVVYLHSGGGTTSPYVTPVGGFTFGATNQYLVGEGSTLLFPTLDCGTHAFFAGSGSGVYPVITNPIGPAIVIDQPNATVSHVSITGSPIGIADGLPGVALPSIATISDVIITGNGGPFQRGIQIAHSTGTFNIDNVRLSNLTNDGLVVSAAGGSANVTNSSFTAISGNAVLASGDGAVVAVATSRIEGTVGNAVSVSGDAAGVTLTSGTIANTSGDAIVVSGSAATVGIASSAITNTSGSGLVTTAAATAASITATSSTIDGTGNPAIDIQGASSAVTLDATSVRDVAGTGVLVAGADARFNMTNVSRIDTSTSDGISLTGVNAFAEISGRSIIANIGGDGITSTDGSIHFVNSTIQTVGGAGINASGVDGDNVVWVQGGTITTADDGGIVALNSNLRVEQLDPTNPTSSGTRITNTGAYGILVTANSTAGNPYRVLVEYANISGVVNGIGAVANPAAVPALPDVPTIEFTAFRNNVNSSGNGIVVSGYFDASIGYPGQQLSQVNALILDNSIIANAGDGILLQVTGDSTVFVTPLGNINAPAGVLPIAVGAANLADLENLNNGTTAAIDPDTSQVNFIPGLVPLLPPPPPAQPP